MQLLKWLRIYLQFKYGDKINYNSINHFIGQGITTDFEITIQPNHKLSQFFQYQYSDLINKIGDDYAYQVNVLISKTTFQFNKYLFLRAIVQYDSYFETILLDALISFTLIPGTVLQIGYGSQYANIYWDYNEWMKDHPDKKYYQTDQSLFIKAGYRINF